MRDRTFVISAIIRPVQQFFRSPREAGPDLVAMDTDRRQQILAAHHLQPASSPISLDLDLIPYAV